MSTHDPCFVDELRTLFLFEKLSDEQLEWLCRRGHVETFPAGPVYSTGDPAQWLFVLLRGTIALSQKVGDAEVETTRSDQRGAYSGAWSAFLGKGGPAQKPSIWPARRQCTSSGGGMLSKCRSRSASMPERPSHSRSRK